MRADCEQGALARSRAARPSANSPPREVLEPLGVLDDVLSARDDWWRYQHDKRGAAQSRFGACQLINEPFQMAGMSSSCGVWRPVGARVRRGVFLERVREDARDGERDEVEGSGSVGSPVEG